MTKITKNKIVYEEDINQRQGKALAIVFPDSPEEIVNLIRLSNSDIIPRGSGTSFTSAVSPNDSVIIDLSKMKNIIDLNLNKKTIVVEPGIIVQELNEELGQHGLEFPIIPIFPGIETIGGMIAKNSSGSREIKYSRMINWLDSIEVINGKGERIRVPKSDFSDFVGMEGTTGIIIQATLRLTSKKAHSLTILKSSNLDFIIETNKKLRLEQDISAIDILSRQTSKLLGFEDKYHIFVEYESDKGLFKKADYEKFMKMKNQAYSKIAAEGFYLMDSVRVYADSLEDFLIYLEEKNIPYFGHLASGVIYPCFHPTQKEKQLDTLKFAKKLRASISYNFGFGLKNEDFVLPSDRELIKRIKFRHDPQNKFNHGKLIKSIIETRIELIQQQTTEQSVNKPEEIKKQSENILEKNNRLDPETVTLKKQEADLTPEEREKVRKIAFGFFGAKKEETRENKSEEPSGEQA